MLQAISRIQRFLGCLLCALLISAALDSVPDPPVVKPRREKIVSVCLTSPQNVADRSVYRIPVVSPLRHCVDTGSRADDERAVPVPPLLKQASDSSPPFPTL